MKKLNKILAFVLCAVMLMGLAPVALNGETVVAADAADGVDAVVQGENDLVFVVTNSGSATYIASDHLIKALTVTMTNLPINSTLAGVTGSVKAVTDAERVILVYASDLPLSNGNLYANATPGTANIVITQKCKITKTDYVFGLDFTAANVYTCTPYASLSASLKPADGVYNYFEGANAKIFTTAMKPVYTSNITVFKLGCANTWDYLNYSVPTTNCLIYCHGFDFTIGENVNITSAAADANGDVEKEKIRWPIVMNGDYHSKATSTTQTVKLLSGTYHYVSLRSRAATSNALFGKTINLTLGDITVKANNYMNALIANDNFSGGTMNVTFDGVNFASGSYYIMAGTNFTSKLNPTIKQSTVNLYVKDATFANARGIYGAYVPSGEVNVPHLYEQFTVNVYVHNFKGSFIKLNTGNAPSAEGGVETLDSTKITTSLYYDPMKINASAVEDQFHNYYTLSSENSTINAECGETGNNTFKYLDKNGEVVSTTWTIPMECDLHTYYYAMRDDACIAFCGDCYHEAPVDMFEGKPVVFVNSTLVDDAGHSGCSASEPFETLRSAFDVLNKWGMGGTVVLTGPCYYTDGEDGSGTNAMNLANAGGTVTITSVYDEVDYRNTLAEDPLADVIAANKNENTKSGDACWVAVDYIKFNNDMVMDYVDFIATNNTKTWFMNYNDLTVMDTCATYVNANQVDTGEDDENGNDIYAAAWTDSIHPAKGDATGDRWLNITTGTARGEAVSKGTGEFGTQNIVINAGNVYQILSGNKYTIPRNLGSPLNTEDTPLMEGEAPVVVTNIYIGGSTRVRAIDTYTDYEGWDIETYIHFTNGATNIQHYLSDGAGLKTKDGEEVFDPDKIIILTSAEKIADSAQYVFSYDSEFGGAPVHGVRDSGYATRLSYTASAEWIDTNKVVEFGALLSTAANMDNITYVAVKGEAVNGVAKSVAFDSELKNYMYDGVNDDVTFRAVLEYDTEATESHLETAFSAAPYAVVSTSDNSGNVGYFTVIGDTTVFNYNGIIGNFN